MSSRRPNRISHPRRSVLLVVAVVVVFATTAAASTLAGAQGDGTEIEYDGDAVTVTAEENQTVRGQSDLDPGTTLVVRLQSNGENPFLMSAETTVDEDGTFHAEFDLSNAAPGSDFDAVVLHDGTELDSAPGLVVADRSTATTTDDFQTPEPDDAGWLPVDGYVALAIGAVLAILGVGLLVGVFDS